MEDEDVLQVIKLLAAHLVIWVCYLLVVILRSQPFQYLYCNH